MISATCTTSNKHLDNTENRSEHNFVSKFENNLSLSPGGNMGKRLSLSLKSKKISKNVQANSDIANVERCEKPIDELNEKTGNNLIKSRKCENSILLPPNFETTQLNHSPNSKNALFHPTQEDPNVITPDLEQVCRDVSAIATLTNLGNSCYASSILYVLRYINEFQKSIHQISSIPLWPTGDADDERRKDRLNVIIRLHDMFKSMHDLEADNAEANSAADNVHLSNEKPELRMKPFNPRKLLECVGRVNSMYDGNYQHDAHEFLDFILNCADSTLNEDPDCVSKHKKLKAKRNQTVKNCTSPLHLFQGECITRTMCLECEHFSEMEDRFWNVAIPSSSLSQLLNGEGGMTAQVFRMGEFMRDDDKYWCDICQHHNEAYRSTRFIHLPRQPHEILKSNLEVRLPETIPCLLDSCSNPCTLLDHTFELCAVICHIGMSFSSGHYTVYIHGRRTGCAEPTDHLQNKGRNYSLRNSTKRARIGRTVPAESCCIPNRVTSRHSEWVHFDDDKIRSLDELPTFHTDRSTESPYLLFYRSGRTVHPNPSKY